MNLLYEPNNGDVEYWNELERAAKAERNLITAWLRKLNYQQIADAIEAGEYLKNA
jgi:hypothetical protein